jgi:radical SAM protein with 4Fe4S-binding SPASM domain
MLPQVDRYPIVRSDWQVHLWQHPSRKNGCIVDSNTGVSKPISYELATILRLMTGKNSVEEIASHVPTDSPLDVKISFVMQIAEDLISKNIIEMHDCDDNERAFANPVPQERILRIMQLQITNQCNLLCDHCYADSDARGHRGLQTSQIKGLIDQFVDLGGSKLFITGGEALVRPDLEEIVAYAKQKCLFIYLNTNGFSVTREKAERLVRLGIRAVNISVDGADAKTHDAFRRRRGSFERALNAVDAFKAQDIPVAIQTTLHKDNLDQGAEIFQISKSKDLANYYIVPMIPQGRAARYTEQIPSYAETYAAMLKVEQARCVKGGTEECPASHDPGPGQRCTAATAQIYVRADGACFPCTSLDYDEFRLGRFPDSPLEEIWTRPAGAANEIRSFNHMSIESCRGCSKQPTCKSGCAGNAFSLKGDWRKSDPYGCLMRDVRKEVARAGAEGSNSATAAGTVN